MTVLWDSEKIKAFIKGTLGCRCPEKVFEKIDISEWMTAEHEKKIIRIVVGDTLVIYIVRPLDSDALTDGLEAIALAGKSDRDINHFNRFRLVVSGVEGDDRRAIVAERFKKLFAIDDKMHIHFVEQQMIDGLS
jgi:hypothetical protein